GDISKSDGHNFSTDDWSKIVELSKQGLDSLKQHYNVESFVGLQRKVTINGLEHTVKVIGENEDFKCKTDEHGFIEPDYKKPVALTFQFDNVVSYKDDDNDILPVKIKFAAEETIPGLEPIINACGWEVSNAKQYLNNPEYEPPEAMENEYQPFITQLKEQLGSNAIEKVYKRSFNTNVQLHIGYTTNTRVQGYEEQVFIPSLADIYTSKACLPTPPSTWGQEFKDFYVDEGNRINETGEQTAYSYYKNILGTNIGYWDFVRCLILSDCKGLTQNYWLRSGWLKDLSSDPEHTYDFHQWSVSRWGSSSESGEVPTPIDEPICLSPIFCI
ncbi:MAG: hypothetical protein KBS35_02250, partial [Mycoplasma sp.]|nr:hypothetical protein [Candidatus Hennigella equi]